MTILQRGVQMLKVGGRIVYSTCSFNPMENEAVVAEMLNRANGSLELVDVSHELPLLKRRPGLSSWKVFTKEGQVVEKFEDVPADAKGRFYPSMWAPKNAGELHLEKWYVPLFAYLFAVWIGDMMDTHTQPRLFSFCDIIVFASTLTCRILEDSLLLY